MGLFIVRHEHQPDHCPATDPATGALLLDHLSRASARRYGVEIRGEVVASGTHALHMIISAAGEEEVRRFLAPFAEAGTIDVHPASTCAGVVANGGCASIPPADERRPLVDPEEACQDAIEAGLIVHRAHPLNGETSIPALIGGVVMPNAHYYVRNHFQIPRLSPSTWRLDVGGDVQRPLHLSLPELRRLPSQSAVVTMECAGNGRFMLEPAVPGEQWQHGAVSTAEWTGVPLVEILDRVGVGVGARDVVFRGADQGGMDGRPGPIRFERSLSLDIARDAGALLAYAMNGESIPLQHGYPLRLVVPDWYGVASVKWLTEIDVTDRRFAGYFQAEKYVYRRDDDGGLGSEPVSLQRVRALITEPRPDDEVRPGELTVRGVAWSGAAAIDRVEVSVDDGPWRQARLVGDRHRHSWQWWELTIRLESTGQVSLKARATDLTGTSQPERPDWNRLGYGNNAIQQVLVGAAAHPAVR